MEALKGVKLKPSSKNTTTKDRKNNINKVKGLIQDFFSHQEPSSSDHGPGLAMNFENQMRRSRIESPRYELKQGLLNLNSVKRVKNTKLVPRIIETICGIANLGPASEGYVFLGVADKEEDAKKIEALDKVQPIEVPGSKRHIVGVEREAIYLKKTLEHYVEDFVNEIRNSNLCEPLKTDVLSGNIDAFPYKNLFVIRIRVPRQRDVSYVDGKVFIRDNTSTRELKEIPKIVALTKRFSRE